jgi:hypothetical protein
LVTPEHREFGIHERETGFRLAGALAAAGVAAEAIAQIAAAVTRPPAGSSRASSPRPGVSYVAAPRVGRAGVTDFG